MPYRKSRGRLLRKYIIHLVIPVGIALGVVGFITVFFSYRENQKTLVRLQHQKAITAAQSIERFVGEIESNVRWTQFTEFVEEPDVQNAVEFDFLKLLRLAPSISDVFLVDKNGIERARVSRFGLDLVENPRDFSLSQEFLSAQQGQMHYSDVYFRDQSEPYITISIPAPQKSATIVIVNLKFVWDVIKEASLSEVEYVYVVDADGRLISHPDISLVLQKSDFSSLIHVKRAVTDKFLYDVQFLREKAINWENRPILAGFALIKPLGWIVFAEHLYAEAMLPVRRFVVQMIIILLIGLFLSAGAAFLLARNMLQPIKSLHEGANQIGVGNLKMRIDVRTGDEIEELGERFNSMASKLESSYSDLESKVEQRTSELRIANQHKSEFLANMSHELRTPLNAILGYTALIIDGIYGEVPKAIAETLVRVQNSGKHLLDLINAVLDLSKIDAGKFDLAVSAYSLGQVVKSVCSNVEALAREKGLELKCKIANALPTAHGDERRVTQVLLNLVGNALKFTESGSVTVNASASSQELIVAVSDTGPGIPREEHERIFEDFAQVGDQSRNQEGTGLGLAISKKIIELHGGKISVESEQGNGATFHFSLPFTPPK